LAESNTCITCFRLIYILIFTKNATVLGFQF